MRRIKIAAAALNQTPLDWDGNRARIISAIDKARADGVQLLSLPEMCIPGYGCEDAFHSTGVLETAWEVLQELAPHSKGLVLSLGLPIMYRHAIFNTAAVLADGALIGLVGKKHLCGDGIHYEQRWFKPWPDDLHVMYEHGGTRVPLGDIFFSIDGVRIGFEICEDAWVADRPGTELSLRAVDILLNPSASHFAFGKHEIRKRFVLEGSRAFGVTYVYSNLLGCEAGRIIYDGDCFIASEGMLIGVGERFSFQDVTLVSSIVDLDNTRMRQAKLVSFLPTLEDEPQCIAHSGFSFSFDEDSADPESVGSPEWCNGSDVKEEEFSRAVSLALFDYLRKSFSRGFVVSLSGGADSSAVSCLVGLMVRFGLTSLGLEEFKRKLGYVDGLATANDVKALTKQLLTCVYQRTRNNSDVTRNAAAALAEALGAEFFEFELDALVDGYVSLVSKQLGKELSWESDDVALQNVQARARVPGLWLLANKFGKLLLTTSNRSEAAVGYATMDGDTSGGLNPIGGIDKDFLRAWLRWLEVQGPDGQDLIAALSHVNAQQPTAELRPLAMQQTDEGDLMPYEVLEAIEELAIGEKKTPLEVFKLLRRANSFGEAAPEQLALWIHRFFRLWSVNQWKRERYAPSFHLDDKNLDPKTWCRFPILSGGYARELAELSAYVASLGSKKS